MPQRIQLRRGLAAVWTDAAPVLADGEIGFEHDTGKLKIGDGLTPWGALAYFTGGYNPGAVAISGGTISGVSISATTVTASGTIHGQNNLIIDGTIYIGNTGQYMGIGLGTIRMLDAGNFIWCTGDSTATTPEIELRRTGTNELGVIGSLSGNEGAPQTLAVFAKYIDSLNYSGIKFSTTGGVAMLRIDEAGSGTGTLGHIEIASAFIRLNGLISLQGIITASSMPTASAGDGSFYVDSDNVVHWTPPI